MNACWGLVGVKHRHSLLWFLCEWGLALTIFSINFETTSTAKQLSIRLIIIHCAHKMNISIRTNSFYRPFHFRDIIWKKNAQTLWKFDCHFWTAFEIQNVINKFCLYLISLISGIYQFFIRPKANRVVFHWTPLPTNIWIFIAVNKGEKGSHFVFPIIWTGRY